MNKKEKTHLTVYFRPDELEFLRLFSKRENKSISAYIRQMVNERRFGKSQLEFELDLNQINLPDLYAKVAELNRRIEELEKNG